MITYSNLGQTGRLGNQLWEIAATLGLAFDRNELPCFPNWDYQRYFSLPQHYFGGCKDGTPATELVPHMDERAKPYLQDYSLFSKIEQPIRAYFQPSPIAARMLSDEKWFHELPRPITSVHVRRGDNVTHPLGYHPLRSMEYYRAAIDLMPLDGSTVVFSDDYEWASTHMDDVLGRECVYFKGTPRAREYDQRTRYELEPVLDWIDLFLMAQCDFHVISNSTYAWWGAFLSGNRSPVYPSRWFGKLLQYIDSSLMFPDSWVWVDDLTQGGA